MKKVAYIVFFIPLITFSQISDANLWLALNGRYKINKKTRIDITEELRLKENYAQLDNLLTQVSFGYRFVDWLTAEVAYRFSIKYNLEKGYYNRHRFQGDLTAKYEANKFYCSERIRFQNTLDDPFNQWYFRNRIGGGYKTGKITPYLLYEFYLPLNNPRLSWIDRDRVYVGVDYLLDKKQEISLQFILEREKNVPSPWHNYIISLSYNLRFN